MTKIGDNPPRLPKRFYKTASAEIDGGVFVIRLDGKTAKTRSGKPLSAESEALALAVADEWNAQGEEINFAGMPMTRLAMTARDLAESDAGIWRAATLAFLKSDLLCYRAEAPAELVMLQRAAWDPILDWASSALDVRLKTGAGVVFIEQTQDAYAAAQRALDAANEGKALGVKMAAEIAGSAIIALALLRAAFPAEDLFAASRVDERFQSERWGVDDEAAAREDALKRDFLDAARFLALV